MKWSSLWRSLSKSLLLLTFFLPFVVLRATAFPTIFAKSIFYRTLVEAAIICLSVYAFTSPKLFLEEVRSRFSKKNTVLIATVVYVFAVAVSTVFAYNPYVAFWGQLQRDEGLLMYLHVLGFITASFLLFEKEDWKLYINGFLVSSAVVFIGASIQFFGGSLSFPIELKAESQPGSFIGNPAFLASFMIAVGALFTCFFEYKKYARKWLYVSILLLLVTTVIMTGIRGAFVGLCAGGLVALISLLIQKGASRRLKAVVAVALLLGTLFVGTFIATRSNPFWLSIPTIRRFATLNSESNSLKSRLSAWNTGIKGFVDRPIVGWGPEGFRYVMNVHGDPTDAAYTDGWVDRSHNKLIDIAAMQGAFGLIAYLVLIFSLLWTMRKNILFCSFLVAYFVQNLFVFDSPVSYAVFAAIVSLVAFTYHETEASTPSHTHTELHIRSTQIMAVITLLIAVCGLIYANGIPLNQQRYVKEILQGTTVQAKFSNLDKFLYPFTSAQLELRPMLVDSMLSFGSHLDANQLPYFKKTLAALEEVQSKDPNDPHIHFSLIKAYNEHASIDPTALEQAEKYARQAISFAPYQQKFYYPLSFILFRTGKIDEAIQVAQDAVAIAPNVGKSYLYLALTLIGGDKEAEGKEALKKMADIAGVKKNGLLPMNFDEYRDTQYETFSIDEITNAIVLSIKVGEYSNAFNLTSFGILKSPTQPSRIVSFVQYRLVTGVLAQNKQMVNDALAMIEHYKMKVPFSIETLRGYAEAQNWEAIKKEPALSTIISEFGM